VRCLKNSEENQTINLDSYGGTYINNFTINKDDASPNLSGSTLLTVLQGGNVGIGTTAPTYKLDVAGTGRFTQPVIVGAPTVADHAATKSYVDSTAGGGVGAGTSGQTLRHNGTSWVANSVLYNNGTNIGIGTTNPFAKITIPSGTSYNGMYGIEAAPDVNSRRWWLHTDYMAYGDFSISTEATKQQGANPNLSRLYINPFGNIGIGNAAPTYKLDVSGTGRFTQPVIVGAPTDTNHAATKSYVDSTVVSGVTGGISGTTNYISKFTGANTIGNSQIFDNGTNVGIGTTAPTYKLDVSGTGRFTQPVIVGAPTDTNHAATKSYVDSTIGGGSGSTVGYWTMNGTNISNSNTGNVGIGTTDPGVYRLKVAGDVAITGTLQTQTGSDFAEEFRVTEDLEPGTVVVMAEEDYKSVKAADRAYDSTVVGIVSDNPSIIAGKVDSDKKVVVAMMGVVSVKADVTNGRIRKGDLLTSSSIAGYAMKATKFQPGTIIGKALEDLNESGYLKVLVNLQ